MKRVLLVCFIIFTISISTPCFSQIVNIESARMQSDTVGWMGGGGLSLTLAQNTERIFGLEAESHIQYKTSNDKGLWLLLGDFGFLKIGSEKFISDGFVHLRYNYKVTERLRWEVFTQYQNNMITQIDSRFLLGTGPRFKLVKTKAFRLYAASLAMFENEKERTNPKISHKDIRSSSYISFTFTPGGSNLEVISTTFFQPLFRKISDYRILNQLKLKAKISKHFSLSVKWNYLHDRFPAGDAPRTTYDLLAGAEFEL